MVTMQVSDDLLRTLKKRKINDNDSYEDVIWDLLEDTMELSERTKKHIKQAEKEIKEGKVISFEQLKKQLKL